MIAEKICRPLATPIGEILLIGTAEGLTEIWLPPSEERISAGDVRIDPEAHAEAAEQLLEYFAGSRRSFDLPLKPEGTPFQKSVWQALMEIPYGATISYGELAERIGSPGASRAVGTANGANPLPIVVPCHRVIGSDGSLTGYSGGMAVKTMLLALESDQMSMF